MLTINLKYMKWRYASNLVYKIEWDKWKKIKGTLEVWTEQEIEDVDRFKCGQYFTNRFFENDPIWFFGSTKKKMLVEIISSTAISIQ